MRRLFLLLIIIAVFALVELKAGEPERPGAPRFNTPRIIWTLQFHRGFRDPQKMKKLQVEEPDMNVFSDGVPISWKQTVPRSIVLHHETDRPEAYFYFFYTIGNYEPVEDFPGFAGSPTDVNPSTRGREEDRKFSLDLVAVDEYDKPMRPGTYRDICNREVKVALEEEYFPPLPADVVERNVWKERVNLFGERNKIIAAGLHTSYVVWDKHNVTIPPDQEIGAPTPVFQADQSAYRHLNLPVIKNKTDQICVAVFRQFKREAKEITIKIKGITNFHRIYTHEDVDMLREHRDELKKKKFKKEAVFVDKLIAAVSVLRPTERVIHEREFHLKFKRSGEDYYRLEDTFEFIEDKWIDTVRRITVQLKWNNDYGR
ncbi:MAG: hypothetical protein ACYS8W_11230 [Planctomycetota bacterium]